MSKSVRSSNTGAFFVSTWQKPDQCQMSITKEPTLIGLGATIAGPPPLTAGFLAATPTGAASTAEKHNNKEKTDSANTSKPDHTIHGLEMKQFNEIKQRNATKIKGAPASGKS